MNPLRDLFKSLSKPPRQRRARRSASNVEWLELRCLLTTYSVGPGLEYANIGAVPWDDLTAGDTVEIHYRPEPYRELILITAQGTAEAPVRVVGVKGPNGERPVIDGDDATVGPNLNYVYSGLPTRGLLTISPDGDAEYGIKPSYIEVSGLQLRNAHLGNSFTRPGGVVSEFQSNAAGIYVERGEHITIRDCEIDHNSNGLFVASGDEEALQSREILVQGNYIHDNGNIGSDRQHNIYTEAIGITFADNYLAPLLPGSGGANLKDRSAGLVVRNNWIEGGAYLMDLVDAEGSFNQAGSDPRYYQTYVYGNVLLDKAGPGNASNLIHYGGDSGDYSIYRNGTLYFYQNTVVIQGRRSGQNARWFTDVFRFDTLEQHGDIRNNIFYRAGDPAAPEVEQTGLALFDNRSGTAHFETNWISPGWHVWRNDAVPAGATVTGLQNLISNNDNDPGFFDLANYDLRLGSHAPVLDLAGPWAPAVTDTLQPLTQYVVHQENSPRTMQGPAFDLGAFEGTAVAGPGRLQFSVATTTTQEDAGTLQITVQRVGGTAGEVHVDFATANGTAQAGTDYVSHSGTLIFQDGQSSAQFSIELLDNAFSGPAKNFQIVLTNASGGAILGSLTSLTVIIANDESDTVGIAPVGFAEDDVTAPLVAGPLQIALERTGDLTASGTVRVAAIGKSARPGVHFAALDQIVTFAAGVDSSNITLQLLDLPLPKGKKILRLTLTDPTGDLSLNRKQKTLKVKLLGLR